MNKSKKFLVPVTVAMFSLIGCAQKPTYKVFCEVNGVTLSNATATQGQDYNATIGLNSDMLEEDDILPSALTKVTSGNEEILETSYTYSLNDSRTEASITIPGKFVVGDITIDLELTKIKKWYEYKDWWNYCSNGNPISQATLEEVGKEVDLVVNDQIHKIRLIDVDKDVDAEGKHIHTTFEFANLLSDSNGNSLSIVWNDVESYEGSNHNFEESTMRNALNGENVSNVLWGQKGETKWSDTYKCSVLDMLPKDLVESIKTPAKVFNIYNSNTEEFEEITFHNDKLFLLTPQELGANNGESGNSPYYYYKDAIGETNAMRVKSQVNITDTYTGSPKIPEGSGQVYKGDVTNIAGRAEGETKSAVYWSRWAVLDFDMPDGRTVQVIGDEGKIGVVFAPSYARLIAPAFCI